MKKTAAERRVLPTQICNIRGAFACGSASFWAPRSPRRCVSSRALSPFVSSARMPTARRRVAARFRPLAVERLINAACSRWRAQFGRPFACHRLSNLRRDTRRSRVCERGDGGGCREFRLSPTTSVTRRSAPTCRCCCNSNFDTAPPPPTADRPLRSRQRQTSRDSADVKICFRSCRRFDDALRRVAAVAIVVVFGARRLHTRRFCGRDDRHSNGRVLAAAAFLPLPPTTTTSARSLRVGVF